MDRVVLLDTHAFLWWVSSRERLSRPALRALTRATSRLLVDISLREIAMLAARGRIELNDDAGPWLRSALSEFEVTTLEISPEIASRSTRIAADFHADPADQLIAAAAIVLDVPLVTADERLRSSPAVRTIW